ncbi:uncharacterized protein LAJ45_04065 [Morchella importuna]|nr:uncharacterized protein LAJ45_04065 [Morchella importuna]KAH8152071.1 hypothetical protein LAJ45_04065 [Morchella importuna]
MTSPSDAASVPLPAGDDTAYFNTPQSSVLAPSPRTRNRNVHGSDNDESTPKTTRTQLEGAYSNMDTPTPLNMLGPQELETPRGRPQQRGGKYHPGQSSAARRSKNLNSSIRQESRSSGPDSGSDEEVDEEVVNEDAVDEEIVDEEAVGKEAVDKEAVGKEVSEEEVDSSEDDFEQAEYADLDKTAAVGLNPSSNPLNMSTPLQRQFPGLHYSAKSHTTPARRLLANSKNFFGTPSASLGPSTFMNPDILPSAFSEDNINNFSLSSATPHRLNTIQGSPAGIEAYGLSVEGQLSTQLREKEAKIRHLEGMLSAQTPGQPQVNFDDFFDLSPEKKIKFNPQAEDTPITVKKRRRSPAKETPKTARKTRVSSRTGSKSPVKAFLGLFESITPIRLTAEERKEERRRRETQEFRQFSSVDLEALKGYLPPVVDEKTEDATEPAPTTTRKSKSPAKSPAKNSAKSPAKSPAKNSAKIIETGTEHPETIAEEVSQPEVTIAPPPPRGRKYRSSSAPPARTLLDAKTEKIPPIQSSLPDNNPISILQARVAQLEEELENATVSLQSAIAALNGERRARIAAEETWCFLEMERKFGACCKFAHAAGKETTEVAATVPLPKSPVENNPKAAPVPDELPLENSRYGASTRPASRMDRAPSEGRTIAKPVSRMDRATSESRTMDRPSSRMDRPSSRMDRPSSRMAIDRPASRMERGRGAGQSTSTSKIGNIQTAPPQNAGKKRPRDESANSGISMRKAPIPRQQAEKKVLGGLTGAANVPLGGGATSGLKKPTLGAGAVRAPTGAAAGTRSALARQQARR